MTEKSAYSPQVQGTPTFYSSLSRTAKLSAEIQVLFGKISEFFHLLLPKLEIQIIKIIEDLTAQDEQVNKKGFIYL